MAENEFKILPQSRETVRKILQEIADETKKHPGKIEKVGVGVPGTVHQGVLDYSPNFPALEGWQIGPELEKIFGAPVVLINDAKAFTYAEAKIGAAKGLKHVVGLTLGSGLGAGIILDGTLYLGKGSAGEIGHTILNLSSLKEAEEFTSAKFFKAKGKEPQEILEAAKKGRSNALKLWTEFGHNLGVITANLANLLDPEAIVVGGGIANAFKFFAPEAQKTAKDLIVDPDRKDLPLLKSALGPSASAIGAALLAKV